MGSQSIRTPFRLLIGAMLAAALSFTSIHPVYAQNAAETYASLAKRAEELSGQGKYAEALPLAGQALAAAEREFGPQDNRTKQALGYQGYLYKHLGRYEDVARVMGRYLDAQEPLIQQKKLRPDDPAIDTAAGMLADAFTQQGRGDLQEQFLKRFITLIEQGLGDGHPSEAGYVNLLAMVEESLGKASEAAALYKRAADIAEKALRSENPQFDPQDESIGKPGPSTKGDLLLTLNNVSDYYTRKDKLGEAERISKFIAGYREKHQGTKKSDIEISTPLREMLELGQLYEKQERLEDAEQQYRRTIESGEKLRAANPDSDLVRLVLQATRSSLNFLQLKRQQPAPVENSYCLHTDEAGQDALALAGNLSLCANQLEEQHRYDEAEAKRKHVITLREGELGPDNPDLALDLIKLSRLYFAMNRKPEAADFNNRAKAILSAAEVLHRQPMLSR